MTKSREKGGGDQGDKSDERVVEAGERGWQIENESGKTWRDGTVLIK